MYRRLYKDVYCNRFKTSDTTVYHNSLAPLNSFALGLYWGYIHFTGSYSLLDIPYIAYATATYRQQSSSEFFWILWQHYFRLTVPYFSMSQLITVLLVLLLGNQKINSNHLIMAILCHYISQLPLSQVALTQITLFLII